MKKYLLTFEFRYSITPVSDDRSSCTTKTITTGIYDTIEEVIQSGNECLTELEKTFDVRGDRFQLNYLFGMPRNLVTNVCTKDKVRFFGKITTLNYDSLSDTVNEAIESNRRYEVYRKKQED